MSLSPGRPAGQGLRAPPPIPDSLAPPCWLFRLDRDLAERASGSLSRSTLLLRESILEADGEGEEKEREREGGGGGDRRNGI